jgi:WXG100 family type VII secretion target
MAGAGSGYGTSIDAMTKAAAHVEQVTQELNGELNTLRGVIDQVGGNWVGRAATAFNQLMERFNEDATKLNQALSSIHEALASNTKSYNASEEQNAQSLSNITAALG